ncbi:Regulatory protein TetR [Frankia canadensis]|uniref:Regulatory protein TetR n=1 Tax=Frankia canadensis TaxID=1836972 RepID=A0A2I2KJS3_9ACTN|nr:TetR/AcrR family transcriptional regulator [Frankia canadensis]SNQ45922.1 Regulatory protein TetR [Frankia canadensis]SOU53212.1 Regulatory protein TetR [Frankia canadensis]
MVRTYAANGTVPGDEPRHRRTRRDFLASRRDLLDAAGRLLAREGSRFSLIDLAAEAGVSTATAYRHFTDVPAVLDAYYAELVEGLVGQMTALPPATDALAHFTAVCELWVRDAIAWGRAAIRVRSSRGFLERLRAGDPQIELFYATLSPTVTRLVEEGFAPASSTEQAVLLWVTIFDERVVVDLFDTLGWSVEKIAEELTAAALRALGHVPPAHR